jgi:hypothetical protein
MDAEGLPAATRHRQARVFARETLLPVGMKLVPYRCGLGFLDPRAPLSGATTTQAAVTVSPAGLTSHAAESGPSEPQVFRARIRRGSGSGN